jgi:tetratricopeptide (TPR) repeat protein
VHVEAVGHLDQALITTPSTHSERLFELGMLRCASLRVMGRTDVVLEALAVIEQHAVNDRDRAHVYSMRGNMQFVRGDSEENINQQQQALRYARSAGAVEEEMNALSGIGDAEYMRGHMASAFEHFCACVELARANGAVDVEAANVTAREHARYLTQGPTATLKPSRAAIDVVVKAQNLRSELILRGNFSALLLDLDKPGEALKEAERAIYICEHIGARLWLPHCLTQKARALAHVGRLDAALAIIKQSIEVALDTAPALVAPWAFGALAGIATTSDEHAGALAQGKHLIDLGCVGHNQLWFYRLAIDACLQAGEYDDACHYADDLAACKKTEPGVWSKFFCKWASLVTAVR